MLKRLLVSLTLVAGIGVIVSVVQAASPPGVAPGSISRAHCGPGDRPEPGMQGQVPMASRLSGDAALGYYCNLTRIGHLPGPAFANFDTYKNCGYYTNNPGGTSVADGVGEVVDLTNPRKPVQTDSLTAVAMRNAGESLRVNVKRGLLVADHYNIIADPRKADDKRYLAVYDVSKDCRHPRLLADVRMPTATGHEGCFQPDGQVYYMDGTGDNVVTPVDLSDPRRPKELASWPMPSPHGCSISDDGNIGYFASLAGAMSVLDTSEARNRKPGANYKVLAQFTSGDNLLQQGTLPLSYKGKPHLFLWSEGTGLENTNTRCDGLDGGSSMWGYGHILDVSTLRKPKEVSKLQLEVDNPANCQEQLADRTPQRSGLESGDPFWSAISSLPFMYDFHQCRVDRLNDPTILACAAFGSGLRVFDIRNPASVKEIAYYNTGTPVAGAPFLDYAAAHPVIRRDLGQIWWPTLEGGLQIAQFRPGVWPFKGDPACASKTDYYAAQYDLQHAHNCSSLAAARPTSGTADGGAQATPRAATGSLAATGTPTRVAVLATLLLTLGACVLSRRRRELGRSN